MHDGADTSLRAGSLPRRPGRRAVLEGPVDDLPVNLGPQTQESGKIKAPWSRPTFDRWVSINPTMIGSAAEMSPLIFSRYLDIQL